MVGENVKKRRKVLIWYTMQHNTRKFK